MERYIKQDVSSDLVKKIIMVSGPRQCGKTTLSRSVFNTYEYLNIDLDNDRLRLADQKWKRNVEGVIFDELHKMTEWKRWLKGIYDTEGLKPKILVTGSANLEILTNVGDSLAGRYFYYRLHPIDIKEAVN